MDAGKLRERVAFDRAETTPDEAGGFRKTWAEHYACAAQVIYHRGGEEEQAARLAGARLYKVRIRSCAEARAVTTNGRMRDLRRGEVYNIREVDPVSDRAWVYIVAESGVATGDGTDGTDS